MGNYCCLFGKRWRQCLFGITRIGPDYEFSIFVVVHALVLCCFSISSIVVALLYAADCPHEGSRLSFFLLATGLVGLFDSVMIFFSNSLWSKYKGLRCEGSKETVCFVNGVIAALTFTLFVFVFVGLAYGSSADNSNQCTAVVWKFTLAMSSLGLISFLLLCAVCILFGGKD